VEKEQVLRRPQRLERARDGGVREAAVRHHQVSDRHGVATRRGVRDGRLDPALERHRLARPPLQPLIGGGAAAGGELAHLGARQRIDARVVVVEHRQRLQRGGVWHCPSRRRLL
jgi:hypothetical protein